jgi:hypothetical protein
MQSAIPTLKPSFAINRRRGNRHQLTVPATLLAVNEKPISVTITELSVGGVGIDSKIELKIDTVYQLDSFDTLIPPGMKVRIVSQRKSPENGFEIGAQAL